MRDFVALISASRPEVTIHLVDGASVTGAAALRVWNEGGRLLVYQVTDDERRWWIARSERDVNLKRRRRLLVIKAVVDRRRRHLPETRGHESQPADHADAVRTVVGPHLAGIHGSL